MRKTKQNIESLQNLNDEITKKLGIENTSDLKYLLKSSKDNYINNKLQKLSKKNDEEADK